jgi:hypothetical protein
MAAKWVERKAATRVAKRVETSVVLSDASMEVKKVDWMESKMAGMMAVKRVAKRVDWMVVERV